MFILDFSIGKEQLMITIENLTKYYGSNRAVNHISFTINDNEILGFLGPNGAGKSTTMNMIAGYLPMSDGKVTICGADVTKNPMKAKRNIGYLPEIPPVYPDMKVREYLSFCAGLKKVPVTKRKSEIERVMKLLKIKDVEGKLIRNLSNGYKQRVGFAQALLGDPKFLILDEPTVGLDPNQVAEVRALIKSLKKDLGENFKRCLEFRDAKAELLAGYNETFDFEELGKLAIDYSDGIVVAAKEANKKLVKYSKDKGLPFLDYQEDFGDAYEAFYGQIYPDEE